MVTPSATVYHRVSRRRMVVMSDLHDVPDAAHRVHQLLRMTRVDLLPQPVDHHVHDVGARIEVVIPRVLGDERAGHHPSRMPHQVLEDSVLLWRQVHALARAPDLARGGVELEIADPEHRLPGLLWPPAPRPAPAPP